MSAVKSAEELSAELTSWYHEVLAKLAAKRYPEARALLQRQSTLIPVIWQPVLEQAVMDYQACFVIILLKEMRRLKDWRCSIVNPQVIACCKRLRENVGIDYSLKSSKEKEELHQAYHKVAKTLFVVIGSLRTNDNLK